MAEVRKKRVLVIDDAALVRLYYRDALEGAGFEVDEALNGLEALEKLLTTPADLLIVDVNMPQMDGFTFLRTLRRQELPLGGTPAMVIEHRVGAAGLRGGARRRRQFLSGQAGDPREARVACGGADGNAR